VEKNVGATSLAGVNPINIFDKLECFSVDIILDLFQPLQEPTRVEHMQSVLDLNEYDKLGCEGETH
jgi:hypothetical protein